MLHCVEPTGAVRVADFEYCENLLCVIFYGLQPVVPAEVKNELSGSASLLTLTGINQDYLH